MVFMPTKFLSSLYCGSAFDSQYCMSTSVWFDATLWLPTPTKKGKQSSLSPTLRFNLGGCHHDRESHWTHTAFNFVDINSWFCFPQVWQTHHHVLFQSTRWDQLWDHPNEQHFACSPLWAGSLHFPPLAGCFFHGGQGRPGKSEAMRAIPWYQDRTGYTPMRSRFRCWWARRWRIVAIVNLHCLSEHGNLSRNRYWFLQTKLVQLLYPCVSPFCTRSRGLVLRQQGPPHRVQPDKPSPFLLNQDTVFPHVCLK